MAIVNANLDVSEQVKELSNIASSTSAGPVPVVQMPWPGILKAVAIAASSLSSAPFVNISVQRFTAGGITTIAGVGTTLAVQAFGTSAAYQLIPLAAAGSTLLQLQTGDLVCLGQSSANTTSTGPSVVTVCVQALQDIRTHFNVVL